MESCDNFYQIYPSNAETQFSGKKRNSSSGFILVKTNALRFENPDEWLVGLSEIIIPGTYYNVYEPFNRGMLQIYQVPRDDHWRWGKDFQKYLIETNMMKSKLVCEISVDPGFYTTKLFCEVANDIASKYLSTFNNKKGIDIALREAENAHSELQEKIRIQTILKTVLEEFHSKNKQETLTPSELEAAFVDQRERLINVMRNEWSLFLDNWKPAEKDQPPPPLPDPPTLEEIRSGELREISTTTEDSVYSGPSFTSWQTTPNVSEAEVDLASMAHKVRVVGPVSSVALAGGILQGQRPGIKRKKVDGEKQERYDLLKLKPHTQKLRINLPPAHYIVCQNERVQKLLGWERFSGMMPRGSATIQETGMDGHKKRKSLIYGNTSVKDLSRIILPETCDFGRNNRILFVYCNLVKPTDIGNAQCPILRAVDISVASTLKSPVFHKTFQPIQYHPVANSQFIEIHFELLNGLGEPFPFQHGENTILILHFKRILPKPHSHGMEYAQNLE